MTDAQLAATFRADRGAFSLNVDMQAPLAGVTALFGPSGCGKTTVLRAMAGLERLTGRFAIGETVWQDDSAGVFVAPHRRAVGYVFQDAALFAHLSARDNLLFGAKRAAKRGATPVASLDEIAALLKLEPLLDRAPVNLSGGERQRVALGRAILAAPKLLLMDEPLAALDAMTKDEILPYIRALHSRFSLPVVYVSHDIAEVAVLADRMVVLAAGSPVAQGPTGDVMARLDLDRYPDPFEAGVVLTGTALESGAGQSWLDLCGVRVVVPVADLPLGRVVRLRVRARDVALATIRPEGISIRNILPGTITELTGDPDHAHVDALVDIGGQTLRARLTPDAVTDLVLAPGVPVFALVKSMALDARTLA
ncbi:MAG: molybdenum ABC transporter ATP-binding protein [Pseudomonadota bacterium]